MSFVNAGNNFMSRLADNLSNSDTSLSLDNISGLPNPPFLLTLNNGKENMEIVKVIDIDAATNIFFIQRAQEGTTAQEHDAGSIVENNFTAGTYQALVDEMKDIKEKVIYIEDEGENEHGSYIKYSDGTLICWMSDFELSTRTIDERYLRGSGNLPQSFLNDEYSVSVTMSDKTINVRDTSLIYTRIKGDSNIQIASASQSTYPNGAVVYVDIQIIGKWK